jgi:hypothetical protein
MSWTHQEIEKAIAAANAKLRDPNLSRDDRFLAEAERDVCRELAAMLREEASEPVMAMGEP